MENFYIRYYRKKIVNRKRGNNERKVEECLTNILKDLYR